MAGSKCFCAGCNKPGADCELTVRETSTRILSYRERSTVDVHHNCGKDLMGRMRTGSFTLLMKPT